MTTDEHAFLLGKVVLNLHSLEFMLRLYLYESNPKKTLYLPHGQSFYSCEVGMELAENEMTNYWQLRKLINETNLILKVKNQHLIDTDFVNIRDAIAHGRVSGIAEDMQMSLIKFSQAENGKVKVTVNFDMTVEWFNDVNLRLNSTIIYLHGLIKVLQQEQKVKKTTEWFDGIS